MKIQLRKWAKEKRATLDVASLSSQIKQNLFSSQIYKNAKNIMCYYSFGSEISTLEYFNDSSKNWYLPKINDNDLLVCPYCSNFVENQYKINEPDSKPVNENVIDMIIIPALAVDKNGYRIGPPCSAVPLGWLWGAGYSPAGGRVAGKGARGSNPLMKFLKSFLSMNQ